MSYCAGHTTGGVARGDAPLHRFNMSYCAGHITGGVARGDAYNHTDLRCRVSVS